MASIWLGWTLLVVAVLGQEERKALANNSFDHVLEDVQPCKDSCDQTYPLHTYSNSKHLECCKRGCRFFSLVEFAHDGHDANPNITRDACMASCMEAYSQTGDRYACNIGCANQVPFALQKQTKPGSEDPQSMHLLTPFMFVHNIYNNMVDHMSRIMTVSWSFYLQEDDGKVIVIKTPPEIVTEYLDVDEIINEKTQDDGDLLQLEKSSNEFSLHRVLPDVYHYRQSQDAELGASSSSSRQKDVAGGSTYSIATNKEIITTNADWLGCMARKSGLPRWLIGLTILFSAFTMIWLCLTTAATAPDHHVRSQKVNMHGDIEYLRFHNTQEKVHIQPTFAREAPPLPLKISLQSL